LTVASSIISLNGTVDDSSATIAIINGIGESVSAPNTGGSFTAALNLREGANILTAVGYGSVWRGWNRDDHDCAR
jgi:hypothetical protein